MRGLFTLPCRKLLRYRGTVSGALPRELSFSFLHFLCGGFLYSHDLRVRLRARPVTSALTTFHQVFF